MRRLSFSAVILGSALTFLAVSSQGYAQPAGTQAAKSDQADKSASKNARAGDAGVLGLLPQDSVTDGTVTIDGQPLSYKATAGTLDLFGQDGQRSAAIFYTSYVAQRSTPDRPLTFVFNGGPGAASAFLQLGLAGPKILDFGPTERDGANAKLVDNPQSWLGFTDLVFIDPVGTGWSRTAKADDAKNFYGVRSDAQSIAKTIALFLAHSGRTSSSKYILGESYGGFRAVKVANSLKQDQGIIVSGIVMLSPLIDGPLLFGASKLALGAALQLPSLAATELERRKAFSEDALHDAEKFAIGEFLTTLAGPAPKGPAADAFYARVAKMTGLPIETVRKTRGFVGDDFTKSLREDQNEVVSSYDAAFAAPDPFPESASDRHDDPVLDGFVRAYGGAFSAYARDQLGFKTEMTYALLAGNISGNWDWGNGSRAQVNASDDLRDLLATTPAFRVLVAHGYSDLVTPYAVSKYIVDHLPEALSNRVALRVYRGGHMLYTRRDSRLAFTADAKAFYAAAQNTKATVN